jgi:predicted nucleotidyltransferase
MKLLSKNEFLHYKRNEKRINYQEPEVQVELKIPEIFAFSQENAEKFLGSLDLKPVTSDDREKVEKIIENISQRFQNSRLSLVGSFALGTWSKSGNIDVTIMSETSEKSLFLSSIKYKLLPLGSVELIPSKTNPILKYKQKDSDFFINISVNNQKAVDFVREFQPLLSEQVKKLIITVKAFAEAQKWKDVKKGFFSGYDWTFLCISFIQNPQINNEFQGNSNEKNFYKFLHFAFNALGKKVELKKGILDEKTDSLIGIVDFFTGKENDSRAKLARKQGKEFKKRLAAVLNELSYS